MKLKMVFTKYFVGFSLLVFILPLVQPLFKMTNAHCESFNQSWAVFQKCRLRAVKRDVAILDVSMDLLKPAHEIQLHGLVLKKAIGGYKPFVVNFTIDACEYIRKKNNAIANVIYPLFKDFSNINHSCPYMGTQIIDGFYPKHEIFQLPLPNGDYVIMMTWYLHKMKTFVTNVYFSFYTNE